MKPKMIVKLGADILMTVALLFLMGYQFWGRGGSRMGRHRNVRATIF